MKPVLKLEGHDYTVWLESLEPARNDMDADGAGRNLIDGDMYRARIGDKMKWTAKFLPLPELIMKSIAQDTRREFVKITFLDPNTDRILTGAYYSSTLNFGSQRYDPGAGFTKYHGCNFNITER